MSVSFTNILQILAGDETSTQSRDKSRSSVQKRDGFIFPSNTLFTMEVEKSNTTILLLSWFFCSIYLETMNSVRASMRSKSVKDWIQSDKRSVNNFLVVSHFTIYEIGDNYLTRINHPGYIQWKNDLRTIRGRNMGG